MFFQKHKHRVKGCKAKAQPPRNTNKLTKPKGLKNSEDGP